MLIHPVVLRTPAAMTRQPSISKQDRTCSSSKGLVNTFDCSDTSTHIFFKTLCNSLTWHEFLEPPEKVLDLGCGTGVWILDAAKQWPTSHFTGTHLPTLNLNTSLKPHTQDSI
jgi:ubiquinone/menaquinone biosynthesis C-methylase UbiE